MFKERWWISASRSLARLVALALVFLALVNCFVHRPREWRREMGRRLPQPLYREIDNLGNSLANYTDSIGLTGRDVKIHLSGYDGTNAFFFAGAPRVANTNLAPSDVVVLQKEAFVLGWSPSRRHSVWAAYRIPREAFHELPRLSYFRRDPMADNAPAHHEYTNSGYDRGHMVPNHAMASRFGPLAQRESFMMSNVAPQRPWLNRGPWADVEHRASKHWARLYGDIWMIVGTIGSEYVPRPRLESGVAIPHAFYQIAVARHKGKLQACAVIMPQRIHMRAIPRPYLASIREIERRSGFDFLHELPDDIEEFIEIGLPTRLWPSGWRSLREIYRRRRGRFHWMD